MGYHHLGSKASLALQPEAGTEALEVEYNKQGAELQADFQAGTEPHTQHTGMDEEAFSRPQDGASGLLLDGHLPLSTKATASASTSTAVNQRRSYILIAGDSDAEVKDKVTHLPWMTSLSSGSNDSLMRTVQCTHQLLKHHPRVTACSVF